MKLVLLTALIAVCGAAKLPTDRSYLPPPPSAKTAGGNPNDLQTPNPGLPEGAYTNGFQGVIVDASVAGTRTVGVKQSGLGAPRPSYGFDGSKVGEAAFKTSNVAFRQNYDNHAFNPQNPADVHRFNSQNAPAKNVASASAFAGFSNQNAPNFIQAPVAGQGQPTNEEANQHRTANVVSYNAEVGPDGFNYAFETDNGIVAEQNAIAKNGVQAQGGYSYTGDDGHTYSVSYVADENGYQPVGDHLPTPPPIPEAILKSLEKNAQDEANGVVDDGSYDASKYNTGGDYNANDNEGKYNAQQYSNGGASRGTPTSSASASVSFGNQNNGGFSKERRPSYGQQNRFLNSNQPLENAQSVGFEQQTAAPFGQISKSRNNGFGFKPKPFNAENNNVYSQASESFGPNKSQYQHNNSPNAKLAQSSFNNPSQVPVQNQQQCNNKCRKQSSQSPQGFSSVQSSSASAQFSQQAGSNSVLSKQGYLPPFGGTAQSPQTKQNIPKFSVNAQSSVGFSKIRPSHKQNISVQPSNQPDETNNASPDEKTVHQSQVNIPRLSASAQVNNNNAFGQFSQQSQNSPLANQVPTQSSAFSVTSFNGNAQKKPERTNDAPQNNKYNENSDVYQQNLAAYQQSNAGLQNAEQFPPNNQPLSESLYHYDNPQDIYESPDLASQPQPNEQQQPQSQNQPILAPSADPNPQSQPQQPSQSQQRYKPQQPFRLQQPQKQHQAQEQQQPQQSQSPYQPQQPQKPYKPQSQQQFNKPQKPQQSYQPQQQYQPQQLQQQQPQRPQQQYNPQQQQQQYQPQRLQQQYQSQQPQQQYQTQPPQEQYQLQQQQQQYQPQQLQQQYQPQSSYQQYQPEQQQPQYQHQQPQQQYQPQQEYQPQQQPQQQLQQQYQQQQPPQQHQSQLQHQPQQYQPFKPQQQPQPPTQELQEPYAPNTNQLPEPSYPLQQPQEAPLQQQSSQSQQYYKPQPPQQNNPQHQQPKKSYPLKGLQSQYRAQNQPPIRPSYTPSVEQFKPAQTPQKFERYQQQPTQNQLPKQNKAQNPEQPQNRFSSFNPQPSSPQPFSVNNPTDQPTDIASTPYQIETTETPAASTSQYNENTPLEPNQGPIHEHHSLHTISPDEPQTGATRYPLPPTVNPTAITVDSTDYASTASTQDYPTGTTGTVTDTASTHETYPTEVTGSTVDITDYTSTQTQQYPTGTTGGNDYASTLSQQYTGVTQAEAHPFTSQSQTTNYNQINARNQDNQQTHAEHFSTPSEDIQSTISTQEPTGTIHTQQPTGFTPQYETNPTTSQQQSTHLDFTNQPEIQQYSTQSDYSDKQTTLVGNELYHYNKPANALPSTPADADTTASTPALPQGPEDINARSYEAPQFDVQVFAAPASPTSKPSDKIIDQSFLNQQYDEQQFKTDAFSQKFNPDGFDQQIFDFGAPQNYKPSEALSQTFGKGETFGGPDRQPPKYDEKTGYHY